MSPLWFLLAVAVVGWLYLKARYPSQKSSSSTWVISIGGTHIHGYDQHGYLTPQALARAPLLPRPQDHLGRQLEYPYVEMTESFRHHDHLRHTREIER